MSGHPDPYDYLAQTKAIAEDAGERILAVYQRPFSISEKQDGSPLTEADRAAHARITSKLQALTPDIPVLSEESAAVGYEQRAVWTRLWLVDPLDGTKEFVKRNNEFTVNIALIEDGQPVLGVVLAPALRVVYWACRGQGAFKQRSGGAQQPIRARRYAGGKARIAVSRSHPGERLADFLQSVARREGPPETLAMGSALKMCLVADGTVDVYARFGPTSEWDTAAAQCVVMQAGGRLTNFVGDALVYNKRSLLNPWFIASGAGDYDWISHVNDQNR
jgi:3'(2'), 5'-bisphosphate nucleotidase